MASFRSLCLQMPVPLDKSTVLQTRAWSPSTSLRLEQAGQRPALLNVFIPSLNLTAMMKSYTYLNFRSANGLITCKLIETNQIDPADLTNIQNIVKVNFVEPKHGRWVASALLKGRFSVSDLHVTVFVVFKCFG